MSNPSPNITVPVDLTNPGQFFACCGLLELAGRLWSNLRQLPGVYGWFERRQFCIFTEDQSKSLVELLAETRDLQFDVGDDSDAEDETDNDNEVTGIDPIHMKWKSTKPAILLDWWSDKSIKPWAGSMKESVILRAMLTAIDPNNANPFDDLRRVQYQSAKPDKKGKLPKPKKKEPFYFDPRRGNKSHPLDCGFSPDTHKMEAECCPALEALCFIGLQRARPAATGIANQSRYTVWPKISAGAPGIPANLLGAVTCGAVRFPNVTDFVFNNYFRTDQRKHKTFSQATIERSKHA